jgi:uridine kinase
VDNGFANPYQHFLNSKNESSFPYPALMLYIMSIPRVLFGWIGSDNSFFILFLSRIPMLIADISIFFILKSWLKDKYVSKLIWFYWLSPVTIYICYIHGQLDAIPVVLLFTSIYFLFKNNTTFSAIFLGLALATKTSILITYPFFFLALVSKNTKVREIILFFAIAAFSFFIVNLQYIFDPAFFQMVFQNQEQEKLFSSFVSTGSYRIYLVPASILILFVYGGLLGRYSKNIFLMFLGFSFSIILLFVPPMQGWYFWLIPFLSYFYAKEEGRAPVLFVVLQFFYLLHFIFSQDADYFVVLQAIAPELSKSKILYHSLMDMGFDSFKISNLIITGLQTTLLLNCFWIYKKGIDSYRNQIITSVPFLIGIGGNSGAGKTTVSNALLDIFLPHNTTILRGDDMHKWQRGDEKWQEFTHLDPMANHLHKEIDFLKKLKLGKVIYRRNYDHNTGKFTNESVLVPNNLIIFEGLHPFYLTAQRLLYNLKIFVNPDRDLLFHWKISRDMIKRGYSKEKVIEQLEKREKDSKKYIETQKNKADILIEPMPIMPIKNIGDKDEVVEIYYKLLLANSVYIESIIASIKTIETIEIVHSYLEEDHQSVIIKGTCNPEEISKIASLHISGLEELGINNSIWPNGCFGIVALLLTYYIFEIAEYDKK